MLWAAMKAEVLLLLQKEAELQGEKEVLENRLRQLEEQVQVRGGSDNGK